MSTSVTLPALGESVTEGTVSRWLKQVGDTVEADEPLLEVSTDKVDTEIPSPASGVLLEIKAQEDETVEVGAVLAVIGEPSEADGQAAAAPEAPSEEAAEAPAQEEAPAGSQARRGSPAGGQPSRRRPARRQEPEKPEAGAEAAAETAAPAASSGGPATGTDVTLPELGESVTEGTVSRWLKQVGDSVAADEPLLEVSTDKVDTEIPSPTSGTLLEIRVQEDETVEVGAVLAVIGEAGAAAPPSPEPEPAPSRANRAEPSQSHRPNQHLSPSPDHNRSRSPRSRHLPQRKTPDLNSTVRRPRLPAAPTPVAGDSDTSYVTPLVRKLAKEHGVDLASLNGTGVGGRIRKQDVLAAAEAAKQEAEAAKQAAAAPAAGPGRARRSGGARASSCSQHVARHYREDVTATPDDCQAHGRVPPGLCPAHCNGRGGSHRNLADPCQGQGRIQEAGGGVALLPPVHLEGCDRGFEGLPEGERDDRHRGAHHHLSRRRTPRDRRRDRKGSAGSGDQGRRRPEHWWVGQADRRLASRTRQNKVTPDELVGGTFTITNYGSAGTLMDTPIINQPQVAILGTGALVKRPVVISDARLGEVIAIRDMMYLSLSYDTG